jgi:NADPH-dependent 2,4-dienoyl-CoA reductase/sulfur reductase-like enzyme
MVIVGAGLAGARAAETLREDIQFVKAFYRRPFKTGPAGSSRPAAVA